MRSAPYILSVHTYNTNAVSSAVNGVECGQAQGTTLEAAKEEASHMALIRLRDFFRGKEWKVVSESVTENAHHTTDVPPLQPLTHSIELIPLNDLLDPVPEHNPHPQSVSVDIHPLDNLIPPDPRGGSVAA